MELDIEDANMYFLIPFGEEEDYLMLIGDRTMKDCLATLIKPNELIATSGISNERCYLMMTWNKKTAIRRLNQAKALMQNNKKKTELEELGQWQKDHPVESSITISPKNKKV